MVSWRSEDPIVKMSLANPCLAGRRGGQSRKRRGPCPGSWYFCKPGGNPHVGVDGSTGAKAAVDAVTTRHWPAASEAYVIIAVDRALATAPRRMTKDGDEDRQWVQRVVESAAERLQVAGLIGTPLVMEGDPKRLLVVEAKARQADSIFVGARGVRGIERILLGRVSAAVAARAPCPVEVMRSRGHA